MKDCLSHTFADQVTIRIPEGQPGHAHLNGQTGTFMGTKPGEAGEVVCEIELDGHPNGQKFAYVKPEHIA